MANNDNSFKRYRILDRCLSDYKTKWCMETISTEVSKTLGTEKVGIRTLQLDIQFFRVNYGAPIEVYDGKYYRYEYPEYSIFKQKPSEKEMVKVENAFQQLIDLTTFHDFALLKPELINLMAEFQSVTDSKNPMTDPMIDDKECIVQLIAKSHLKEKINQCPIHYTQKIISENDSNLKIIITKKWDRNLESKILSYGDDIQVIAPKEFRKKIISKIKKMKKGYKL